MSASGPLLIVLLLMVAIFACLSQIYRVSTKMQLLSLCVFIGSAHIPAELCLLVSPFTRPSFPIFRWGAHVREGRGRSGDDTNNILFSHQTLLPPSPLTPPINCREGSVPRETSNYHAHPSFLAYIFDAKCLEVRQEVLYFSILSYN